MSRPSAEGRQCEICERRLLAGEPFSFFDIPARRRHRRPVCPLCTREAIRRDWNRTPELPSVGDLDGEAWDVPGRTAAKRRR